MKILLTIYKNEIAPRFDQSSEIIIAEKEGEKISGDPRIILLPGTSGEDKAAEWKRWHPTAPGCQLDPKRTS